MAGRRAIILWATGAAAAGVVVLFIVHGGKELRIRWAYERARQELLADRGRSDDPPQAVKGHLNASETAYAVFARLLRDDDSAVWIHVLKHAYWNEGARKPDWGSVPLSPFEVYLRDQDPVAWVKYLLPEPYQHGTDWRGWGSTLDFDYWSGHAGQPLAPRPQVLAFLRGFLAGEGEETGPVEERSLRPGKRLDLERRAVYALRAMVAARPPPPTAVELLRWTVAEHRYPAVRLEAIAALTLTESPFGEERPCLAPVPWHLEVPPACEKHLHFESMRHDEGDPAVPFHVDHHLELLAHVDSAWALWVFVRLQAKPDLGDVVTRALGPERGRWSVRKPVWLPLEAAAVRYLASQSLDERVAALLALVNLGTPAARDALTAHEARESHAELRLLARSGLAALGDARQHGAVELELVRRLDAQDLKWRELGSPPTVFAAPRWPWSAEGPGGGWSEPYRIESTHLARHLLLAGSRPALDRVVKRFVDWGESPIDLTRYVDGLPLTPRSELAVDPAEITFSTDREEEQRQLGDWWQANAARLEWNPLRGKFVVGTTHGAR